MKRKTILYYSSPVTAAAILPLACDPAEVQLLSGRVVSIDHLHCLLFAFVLFIMGLATNFAVTLEGEAKAEGDSYLALAGRPS